MPAAAKLITVEEARAQETPIEVFRQAVGPDLTEPELMLAIEYASRRKLDLITKQIIPTVMKQRDGTRRLTFITTIDGLRVIAERSGKYGGQDAIVYGTDDKGNLEWAEATVYRKDWEKPCTVRAYWREFAPDEVKWGTWKKMPHVMLGKVAEAQALRKAFPADMGGLYSGDEMEVEPQVEPGALEAHPTITAGRAGGSSRRVSSRSERAATTTTPEAEASTEPQPSAGTDYLVEVMPDVGPGQTIEGQLADEQMTDAADAVAGIVAPSDLVAAAEVIFAEELPEPEPEPEPTPIKYAGDFPIRSGTHKAAFSERGAVISGEEMMTPRGNAVFVIWMADDRDPQGRVEVVMAATKADTFGVLDLAPGEVINVEGRWTDMADRSVVVAERVIRE